MGRVSFSCSAFRLTQEVHHPKLPISFKAQVFPHNSRIYGVYNKKGKAFSFTLSCTLKTAKGKKGGKKKIVVPDSDRAPTLFEEKKFLNGSAPVRPPPSVQRSNGGGVGSFGTFPKGVFAGLSNLQLAIAEMFAVAGLMALGTIIDQGEAPAFYIQKFPEDNPLLGFFTWRWVFTLGFDHMFSSPIFLGTLALLGASLMACTSTTDMPLLKVARRWLFLHSSESIHKQEYAETLPKASVQDLGVTLMGAGYNVFLKGPALYAFKGLAGQIAPLGVHLALLLVMSGGTLSATGGFRGSVTVPQGLDFIVGDVLGPTGVLSTPSEAFTAEVHVNRLYMDYYGSQEVSRFHTNPSLHDLKRKEVMGKTVSVNDPLRCGDITIYQTDRSFSALHIQKDSEGPFNLVIAPVKINGDKKLFVTFLPIEDSDSPNAKGIKNAGSPNVKGIQDAGSPNVRGIQDVDSPNVKRIKDVDSPNVKEMKDADLPNVKGISMLVTDLQSIVLHYKEGKFVGVRQPNSQLQIETDGTKLVIVDAVGSTGPDLKTDPGVPIVYAGFGSLVFTTCISYLANAAIWALQDGTTVVIGGKTNRADGKFPATISQLLDQVPEILESSSSTESDDLTS